MVSKGSAGHLETGFCMLFNPRLASVVLIAGLAACSGSMNWPVTPTSTVNAPTGGGKHQKAGVRFSFKIPWKKRQRKHGRHGTYLSPSTQSLQVTELNAAHSTQLSQSVFNAVPGATPTSVPCTSVVAGSFSCTYTLHVPPGSVTFDVMAFDQTGAQGNQLSSLLDYPVTIRPGSTFQLNMVLEGVVAKIGVSLVGSSPFVRSDANGLQIAGIGAGAAQNVLLSPEDADGNVIVYATSPPAIALTTADTAKVTITPVNGSPGQFSLTPLAETNANPSPDPASAISLAAKVTPATGAPFTSDVKLQLDPVTYASNAFGNVFSLVPWSTGSVSTMSVPSLPGPIYSNRQPMAMDAGGNLYVAWGTVNEIDEYPPGSNVASLTITGITNPGAGYTQGTMAVDASGNIFLIEGSTVVEYSVTGGASPVRTLTGAPDGIDSPRGLAVDASGNLYVGNTGGSLGVSVYSSDTSVTTPSYSLGTAASDPGFVAFDSAGNLYVTNTSPAVKTVEKYSAPLSSSSTVATTFGGTTAVSGTPLSVTIDASGNVYLVQSDAAVLEFSPLTPTVARQLSGCFQSDPIDALGYVYISDDTGDFTVWPPAGSDATFYPWSNQDYVNNAIVWP
jgi:hypothetical protein